MPDFSIKQGDTLPLLTDTLTYSTGGAVNLTGASVSLVIRLATSLTPLTLTGPVTITNAAAGQVQYAPTSADTAAPGRYQGSWVVTFSGGGQQQFPTDGYLDISIEENLITASGNALVSLGEAKDYLRIPASDRSNDAQLLRFIRDLTPVIEFHTGPILTKTTPVEEWHDGGQVFVRLRHGPVQNLVAVSEFRGPIEWNLAIVTDPAHGQIYSCMLDTGDRVVRRSAGGGVVAFPSGPSTVKVTYTQGRAIPSNVTQGTLQVIRDNWQQTQQAGRPPFGGGGVGRDDELANTTPLPYYVSPTARELLQPQRRHPAVA